MDDLEAAKINIRIYRDGFSDVKALYKIQNIYTKSTWISLSNILPEIDPSSLVVTGMTSSQIPAYKLIDGINNIESMFAQYLGKKVRATLLCSSSPSFSAFYQQSSNNIWDNGIYVEGILSDYNTNYVTIKGEGKSQEEVRIRIDEIEKKFVLTLLEPKLGTHPRIEILISNNVIDEVIRASYVSTDMRYAYTHDMVVNKEGTEVAWLGKVEIHSDANANLSNAFIEMVDSPMDYFQKTGMTEKQHYMNRSYDAFLQKTRSLQLAEAPSTYNQSRSVSRKHGKQQDASAGSSNVIQLKGFTNDRNHRYPLHFTVRYIKIPALYFGLQGRNFPGAALVAQ